MRAQDALLSLGAMANPLDRPVWNALSGDHAHHALGGGGALRYHPDIGPLAGTPDGSPESLAALGALVARTGTLTTLQADIDPVPPGTRIAGCSEGLQMMFAGEPTGEADPRIAELGPDDVTAMVALATLAKPGPFAARTCELGRFWGVFEDGKLAAMAGQRTRFDRFVEVSGVCTSPEHRGKGLAALLTAHAARAVLAEGRTPFLQVYASNDAAIGIYRRIGFIERTRVWLTVLAPEP